LNCPDVLSPDGEDVELALGKVGMLAFLNCDEATTLPGNFFSGRPRNVPPDFEGCVAGDKRGEGSRGSAGSADDDFGVVGSTTRSSGLGR
jgi:hypothetical protein